MLSYIHLFLSPSNLTFIISKESEMSHEKNQVGEEASPADLDLGLIRRRTSWGLYARVLVLCCLQVGKTTFRAFVSWQKSHESKLKVLRRTSVVLPTRFVTGAGQQGIFNTAFSLSFEIIGPGLRFVLSRNSSTVKTDKNIHKSQKTKFRECLNSLYSVVGCLSCPGSHYKRLWVWHPLWRLLLDSLWF